MVDSVYRQVLDAVASGIVGLSLRGISTGEVRVAKLATDTRMWIKGIIVSPAYETVDGGTAEGTTDREMVSYPCVVTMVGGTSHGWEEGITLVTEWREAIRRAFHNRRLDGVTADGVSHVVCKVAPGPAFDSEAYPRSLDVSQLIIWASFLEPRS